MTSLLLNGLSQFTRNENSFCVLNTLNQDILRFQKKWRWAAGKWKQYWVSKSHTVLHTLGIIFGVIIIDRCLSSIEHWVHQILEKKWNLVLKIMLFWDFFSNLFWWSSSYNIRRAAMLVIGHLQLLYVSLKRVNFYRPGILCKEHIELYINTKLRLV